MLYERPRYLDAGDAALVVEFGDSVHPAINARVLMLDAALRDAALAGVEETVPTYRSLMIHYDPLSLSRAKLLARLEELRRKRRRSLRQGRAGVCPAATILHWRKIL